MCSQGEEFFSLATLKITVAILSSSLPSITPFCFNFKKSEISSALRCKAFYLRALIVFLKFELFLFFVLFCLFVCFLLKGELRGKICLFWGERPLVYVLIFDKIFSMRLIRT